MYIYADRQCENGKLLQTQCAAPRQYDKYPRRCINTVRLEVRFNFLTFRCILLTCNFHSYYISIQEFVYKIEWLSLRALGEAGASKRISYSEFVVNKALCTVIG